MVESTDVQTHLSIKLSKKNFRGILRAKSVRRTLVIGLITLYNVCSVDRGMFSTSGGVQYIGGIP